MLNKKLHHVVLSWIIFSSKQMKYDIKENNHTDSLNKGPQYNTAKLLGLNSFMTIMKLYKNGSWIYEKVVKKIPTMKSKTISHDKKDQLLLLDIDCACYLTHLAAWDYYFVDKKTQIFFTIEV